MEFSMPKKRLIAVLFAGIVAVLPLGAATVSVLVIETSLNTDSINSQYSELWENSLMDVFFDMGHIVSNSSRIWVNEKPKGGLPAEARSDVKDAYEGGMNYFVIAIVNYDLSDVSLRLFNTKSLQMVVERKYEVTAFRNTKDENENIKKAARAMAAYLK